MSDYDLRAFQYKRMLEERRGHNYQYWTEELEEKWLLEQGYNWYNIPKDNSKFKDEVSIATMFEDKAKEIVKHLRDTGHYARIICGVEQNQQRIKMYSVLFKKKYAHAQKIIQ